MDMPDSTLTGSCRTASAVCNRQPASAMHHRAGGASVWLLIACLFSPAATASAAAGDPESVLALVNGKQVVSGDVVYAAQGFRQPADNNAPPQREWLDAAVDRELLRQFLERRGAKADEQQVARRLEEMQQAIERHGKNETTAAQRFAGIGLSLDVLRKQLTLDSAWEQYSATLLTEDSLRKEWDEQRAEYDGTRVELRQIVRVLEADAAEADWRAAEALLEELRGRLTAGEIAFADAAREYSQSPSALRGGGVGRFEYHGWVAEEISRVAFSLAPGEVSQPFRSQRSVHLVEVVRRLPGELSLEDARPRLIRRLANRRWRELAEQERKAAKIEIVPVDG